MNRKFRVRFRIPNTNNPTQEIVIQATSVYVAQQLFKQEYPKCELVGTPQEIRE
jgi:hypothetical protein